MTQFLNYAVPGVPFGCVFALMAVGLVLTYKASGVFNLAFGAQAFVSALAYVSLDQDGWPRWASTVIAVLVIGPLVGVLLDRLLFRRIRTASPLVKLVPSLGLLVALPQLAIIIAGSEPSIPPPAIVGNAQRVYLHLGSCRSAPPPSSWWPASSCSSGSRRSASRCAPSSRARA